MNDLAFLNDGTQHLSKLNKQLQGRNHIMFKHTASFQKKLKLFKVQFSMSVPVLTHFPCQKNQHHEGQNINYQKHSTMINNSAAGFKARFFFDYQTLDCVFNIFSNPFGQLPIKAPTSLNSN